MYGALILVCGTFIVKLIGFIYKVPLMNMIGEVGMGYYNTAYNIYVWFFTISTAGIPVAISKMISIANSERNYLEEKRIFRLSIRIFVIIGAFGSAVMLFGAGLFADAAKQPNSYYSLMVIAPTVLFVCITSSYRGYFQGNQNMFPTAISEVIEALGKLCIGLFAIWFAINKLGFKLAPPDMGSSANYDDKYIAAFAVSGLTIGVIGGSLFLIITKFFYNKKKAQKEESFLSGSDTRLPKAMRAARIRPDGQIIKDILKISIPVTLSASLISLSSFIDTFTMTRRLVSIGYTQDAATGAFGSYTTMAVSFFNFPNSLILPIGVSILPVIAAAYAKKETEIMKSTINSAFRIVSIIAMPCAFGIACMSKPILNLLFVNKESVNNTAPLLSVLAVGIVFVAMVSVTNTMLQAQKYQYKTIISMACGAGVKLILSYILVGIKSVGRYGTPISTCLAYLTIMSINFYFLAKYTKIVPSVRKTFMKPFIASAIMAVCAILSYMLLSNVLHSSKVAVLAAIIIAFAIYLVLVLVFKTLTREDVLLLPKGTKLYEGMKKWKLID